ncbi:MAG: DNA repair protein [Boseongicola sp.]|nr:DNA repair protein [Boseongicola sp.]
MFLFASMATIAAIALFVFSTGLAPWPVLLVQLASGGMINVVPALLGAMCVLSALLLAFMPANWRVLALENSHRSFRMRMEDVTQAYVVAHAADREGLFQMSSEFDAVRERIVFLRDHPDLGELEPDVLDVAAQMSRISEDLAARYSVAKVTRAKSFLAQRRDEAALTDVRIENALEVTREMRRLLEAVEMEESVANSRLDQLRGELDSLLPHFDLAPTAPAAKARVVRLASAGGRNRKTAQAAK